MNDPFESECLFHVYNHANGTENVFRCDANYLYFLNKYREFIYPIAETYCYCLMPNHFHLLIKIRSEEKLAKYAHLNKKNIEVLTKFISQIFSNFFNCYAKSFNEMFNRKGSLFIRPFKRKKINSDEYLTRIIHYIHYNAVHHGFVKKIDDWPYNSYQSILSDRPTMLERESILKWFGGIDEFIKFHQWKPDPKLIIELEKKQELSDDRTV
jgi:putative transposase